MARTFFGFALADSMFEGDCIVTRNVVDATFVREKAAGLIPCIRQRLTRCVGGLGLKSPCRMHRQR